MIIMPDNAPSNASTASQSKAKQSYSPLRGSGGNGMLGGGPDGPHPRRTGGGEWGGVGSPRRWLERPLASVSV